MEATAAHVAAWGPVPGYAQGGLYFFVAVDGDDLLLCKYNLTFYDASVRYDDRLEDPVLLVLMRKNTNNNNKSR